MRLTATLISAEINANIVCAKFEAAGRVIYGELPLNREGHQIFYKLFTQPFNVSNVNDCAGYLVDLDVIEAKVSCNHSIPIAREWHPSSLPQVKGKLKS
jgi:hypothetical protein